MRHDIKRVKAKGLYHVGFNIGLFVILNREHGLP